MMINELRQEFLEMYGTEPMIVTTPGRVNLIGEHTDYNNGFVLPGAIDKKIYVAVAKNSGHDINVYANQFKEHFSFSPHNIEKNKSWKNYLLGVTYYFQQQTRPLTFGLDVIIDGDVPVGGGMSSSAALCSAFGTALNELYNGGLSKMDLAFIGQKTEHNFAGVMCGIMDQFAVLHGKHGYLMKLDCRDLSFEYIPFDIPQFKIVLVNTMVSHSLAGSEYNTRRKQCEEGVKVLQQFYHDIKSLRDVSIDQLISHKDSLDPVVYRRCKYVVEEIARVEKAAQLLKQEDLASFGLLMYETHDGLSNDYEVSCPELDFLVKEAKVHAYVAGARMMGGGFGGCTINLVESSQLNNFIEAMQSKYQQQFGKVPEVYVTTIEDGAKIER